MVCFYVEKEPKAGELLEPDETIINPHYMKQLLIHGVNIGLNDPNAMENRDFDLDAQVRSPFSRCPPRFLPFVLPLFLAFRIPLSAVFLLLT